ncbi:flagellar assembly peptidoglycan hydrolase FlgJ [Pseudoxanthomonas mexicana]|uniref:Peptidoglycan hydrolase FlgJ n=1 Tax=Pseudoxanthomonas mexicana TaxID=128785 RepID=A0ABX6RG40_PSEMX|nr:flagellar assembly peptidoglycan hydrolase FlgJ [Pseudoxanthomonas mexicana]QLQ30156.1 MAG: flagellar assembly peptidoglycan hydrolase FlgJ [Pseudoxanthomonas sp.]QND82001.1 flagellar assembly peptidoglycan hydrolase FlgJ [Pseudoxanthomonas mexicana]
MPIGTLNPSLPLADAGGKPDNARIHEVARKLEGQFAQMMIKCMREAGFGDSLFPGENQIFRDMYDQQIATAMSQGSGLGLAPMIARQLGATDAATPTVPATTALSAYKRLLPGTDADSMLDASAGRGIGSRTHASSGVPDTITLDTITVRPDAACDEVEQVASADPAKYARNTPERFVAEIWGHAQKAAKELGVDPRALVAQAALETGWGKRQIKTGEGDSAHNLFGIKATGWKGERARTATHEYVDGVKRTETADFRAYASPAESFADYVRLLKSNPRYQQALAAGKDIAGFARGLQRAGYATDPTYANKIASIANGPTLGKVLSAIGTTVAGPVGNAVGNAIGNALRR